MKERGRSRFLCLLVFVLFVTSSCSADDKSVKVVGHGECADCKQYNIKTSQAFSGLRVTVDCKLKNGEMKRRGYGELDAEGKFEVSIPKEILKDGKLEDQDCYAQLYSVSAAPCPAHNGLEASKIVFKSGTDGKLTFGPAQNVKFSSALCTSAFLWPFFKYPPLPHFPKAHHPWFSHPPLPHFPKGHPWFSHPPFTFPPIHKKPLPPPVPTYKPKPPAPVPVPPVYHPPTPVYVPKPPPVYHPPTPVYVPKPPPVYHPPVYVPKPPVYHPPVYVPKPPTPVPVPPVYVPKPPTPVPVPPVYVPKPPTPVPVPPVYVPKPPTPVPVPPVYNPPVYHHPLPPFHIFPKPPFPFKKPCPPFPKLPPFPKVIPHVPVSFPPLPPHINHP